MTDKAQVLVKEKSTPWLIWLLPVIALCIGAWLIYKSYRDAGVEVTLLLPLGSSITPNETEIRYEGVKLGVIKSTALTNDLKKVRAVAEIDKRGSVILQEDTVFWLVQPRITVTQISGLDTLVSGKYITFQLGESTSQLSLEGIRDLKPVKKEYDVLMEVPPRPVYLGGLQLNIASQGPVSISEGAPVSYQKFRVGEVDKVSLSPDGKTVNYRVFIEDPYKQLVNTKTRFWNTSGISIKGSLANVDVQVDSLTSVLVGGISFGNSDNETGAAVDNFHEFVLFPDRDKAFSKQTRIRIRFADGDGLSEGTPIKYNGLQVGSVESVELQRDLKSVMVNASIYENAANIARASSRFWVVKPELGLASTKNLDTLLAGKYITVQPGDGKPTYQFAGLDAAPVLDVSQAQGQLEIVLTADQLGSVKKGTKVYYRNVVVGSITGHELAPDAHQVRIYASIEKKYAPLVRERTKFWNASGIDVGFKLFGGLNVKTESVESLLEGGVAFATPPNDQMGEPAKSGTVFSLHAKAEESWEKWTPTINLNP